MLHLQWTMLPNRNQMKQAWYRCIEWMTGRKTAAADQRRTAHHAARAIRAHGAGPARVADGRHAAGHGRRRAAVLARSRRSCGWFDERGVEFFEPLEIWHVPALRAEFRRRAGRSPRPDRSYLPPRLVRAQALGRRVLQRRQAADHPVSAALMLHRCSRLPILPAPTRALSALRGAVRARRQTRRPVPQTLAVPRALRAGAKRRRGTAGDSRGLQLQPAHVRRARRASSTRPPTRRCGRRSS